MNSTVILLTGQYGTSHKTVADTLRKMAEKTVADTLRKRAEEELSLIPDQPIVMTYSIDDALWKCSNGPTAFFKLPNDKMRDEYWQDAFSLIKRDILNDNPVYAIVSLHIVYFWEKRFFSCVDWDRLMSLQPRVILTLIDDIYDIYNRIVADHKRGSVISDGKISISDILSWRIREIHTCNLLAKNLYVKRELFPSIDSLLNKPDVIRSTKIPNLEEELHVIFNQSCDHFVISVKQNPKDFYCLLFKRKKMRVYLSFPISKPRENGDNDFFNNLLAFRKKIHKDCIAFDPLAIDELRFVVNKNKKGNKIVTGKLTDRIIYGIGTPIVSPPANTPERCPIQEDSESLESIYESVVQQINERDLKLTSQASLVVMWRPLYGKKTHDGVAAEGTFAAAKGITVHSYHPKQDRIKGKPFIPNIGTQHQTKDAFFKAIKECQKEYEVKQIEETYCKRIIKQKEGGSKNEE